MNGAGGTCSDMPAASSERLAQQITFTIPRVTTHDGSFVMYHIACSLNMSPSEMADTGARLGRSAEKVAERFVVRRRFSDFKSLQALVARAANRSEREMNLHFPLPNSGVLTSMRPLSSRLIADRQDALQTWIETIFQQELFRASPPLVSFLTDDSEPAFDSEDSAEEATAAARFLEAIMAEDAMSEQEDGQSPSLTQFPRGSGSIDDFTSPDYSWSL